MKLNTPVEDIKPALLNEDSSIPTDAELLTVIGYGRTTDGGEGTSTLQEVGVNYIPPAECSNYYSGLINGDTMICAATGETKGSCQGDSGGPLVIQDGDTYTQVGIVSWGALDAQALTFLVSTAACRAKLIGSRPRSAIFPTSHPTIVVRVASVQWQ
jgi:secreted trypsin-like serine protease